MTAGDKCALTKHLFTWLLLLYYVGAILAFYESQELSHRNESETEADLSLSDFRAGLRQWFRSRNAATAATDAAASSEWVPMNTADDLFEGDIELDSYFLHILPLIEQDGSDEEQNGATTDDSRKWPGGIVPYRVSSSFNSEERATLVEAMAALEADTCIRFEPRTDELDYIFFSKEQEQCRSFIGRTGDGKQNVMLGTWSCISSVGTILHELLHTIGFFHEQSRYDRDNYIVVRNENIYDEKQGNFNKYAKMKMHLKTPYDYGSIMHYPSWAFSKNNKDTIETILPGVKIGQLKGLSEFDIYAVNKFYDCPGHHPMPAVSYAKCGSTVYNISITGCCAERTYPIAVYACCDERLVALPTEETGNCTPEFTCPIFRKKEPNSSLVKGTRFVVGLISILPVDSTLSSGPQNTRTQILVQNDNAQNVSVHFSSQSEQGGTIVFKTEEIPPESTQTIELDKQLTISFYDHNKITHKGLMVESTLPITVYVELLRDNALMWDFGDTYLALPVDQLSSHYYAISGTGGYGMALVIAIQPDTIITVNQKEYHMINALDTVHTLRYGEVVEIISNKPVAVVAGSHCAHTTGRLCSSVQVSMQLPVNSWGLTFPYASFYTELPYPSDSGNWFHITAAENGTVILVINSEQMHEYHLNKGDLVRLRLLCGNITSTKPIAVQQFGLDGYISDDGDCCLDRNTFAVHVPSTDHYVTGSVTVTTVSDTMPRESAINPITGHWTTFHWNTTLRIVSQLACIDQFTLDGETILTNGTWIPLGPGYYYGDVPIEPGTYNITCAVEDAKYLPTISGVSYKTGYAKIGQMALPKLRNSTEVI